MDSFPGIILKNGLLSVKPLSLLAAQVTWNGFPDGRMSPSRKNLAGCLKVNGPSFAAIPPGCAALSRSAFKMAQCLGISPGKVT
jgi:hypothetical protein